MLSRLAMNMSKVSVQGGVWAGGQAAAVNAHREKGFTVRRKPLSRREDLGVVVHTYNLNSLKAGGMQAGAQGHP